MKSKQMLNKLDFCIVGPQRTSTTWIYEILLKSSQVSLPTKVKETFFFDQKYKKGLGYYFSLFGDVNSNLQLGEVAPTYFHQRAVINRLKAHNPECKIIIIYRNPIEKAISLYKHHLRKGRVGNNFQEAVNKYPEIIESGKYSLKLLEWENAFGASQVKVVSYDLLKQNAQMYIDEITVFLNLKKIKLADEDFTKVNEESVPKYPVIARVLSYSAVFLRKYDLHFIANFGKNLGLTNFYKGGRNRGNYENERAWLKSFYKNNDYLY